ncbi:MAG: glycosyltransferase family 39 protein, partial [Chloroflexi bacterium]|nr:glycosyltransferase family 39 protein [Chloroflexota bacterium]
MVAAAPETTPPSPRGLRHLWRWATGQEASRWRFPPLLLALLAIALALRLYGISWDQGSLFHPDERSIYMRVDCMYRVLTKAPGYGDCTRDAPFQQTQPGFPSPTEFLDARKSPLNPHWFPLGTLILYVLLAVKFALAPIMTTDLQDLAMAGRTLAALADVATIGMAYAMGARLYGRGAGLLAAALITFAAIHIQISHFYRPEPFYNLFLLVAFWQMLNVLERHRVRDSAWLGVFIGLTFATKASALPILLPVAAAYGYLWMRRPRVEAQGPSAGSGQALAPLHRLSSPLVGEGQDPQGVAHQGEPGQAREALALRVLLTGVTALAVYLLATPYALLSFPELLEWDLRELDIVRRAGIVPYTVQYIGAPRLVYELQQTTLWGLGIPLGVLAWGGFLAALALNLWRPRLPQVLLLLWAVPLLFTIAAVQVKFLRYTFPLVPVFILLGSGLAVQAIAWLQKHSRLASRAAIAGVALVVAATVFYALAFESIYTHPHTAVQASRWLNANAPPGAEILTDNHWDEGIPDLGRYQVTQLPMFDGDSAAKMDSLARNLSRADYLVFYSNRTYGAIARAVERYPYSSAYYLALFRGDLGFQLAASFSSYPSLLGVAFADDPFTRAGLPAPQGLREQQGAAIWLDLGYADNDVITYDHPLTLVFQNTARWNKDQLLPLLLQPRAPGDRAPQQPLMLTPQELAVQQSGGTWRDLFHPGSLANRIPVLAWLFLVETAFLATWPLAFAVFRGLHDRGYLLAKALALLLLAY